MCETEFDFKLNSLSVVSNIDYIRKIGVLIAVYVYRKKERNSIFEYAVLKVRWIVGKNISRRKTKEETNISSSSAFFDKWYVYLHENIGNIFSGPFYEVDADLSSKFWVNNRYISPTFLQDISLDM